MNESKLQTKILKYLKQEGYYSIKTILCNRNGVPDIIACSPTGQFVALEVKFGKGRPSKLQEWNIAEIKKVGGKAGIVWSIEDVKQVLNS